MKKLPLNVLEEKARVMTKEALKACEIPDGIELFLTTGLEQDEWIFGLHYFNQDEMKKVVTVAEARVNAYSGEGTVKTFLPSKKHQ